MRTRIGPARQRGLRLARGGDGSRRGRKGDEEGVALGVDLDAAVGGEGVAQEAAVLGQRIGVALGAEGVEQLRRALDVGEQEGDRAGWKVARHVADDAKPLRIGQCAPGSGSAARVRARAYKRRRGVQGNAIR